MFNNLSIQLRETTIEEVEQELAAMKKYMADNIPTHEQDIQERMRIRLMKISKDNLVTLSPGDRRKLRIDFKLAPPQLTGLLDRLIESKRIGCNQQLTIQNFWESGMQNNWQQ